MIIMNKKRTGGGGGGMLSIEQLRVSYYQLTTLNHQIIIPVQTALYPALAKLAPRRTVLMANSYPLRERRVV
jgi:hypothetical protein